jgi:hypothetical protein
MTEAQNQNVLIEIDNSGVVQVHSDLEHAEFLKSMAPAIEQLDLNIRIINEDSEAQAEVVGELAEILQRAPHLEQIKADTKAIIEQADQSFLDVLSAK